MQCCSFLFLTWTQPCPHCRTTKAKDFFFFSRTDALPPGPEIPTLYIQTRNLNIKPLPDRWFLTGALSHSPTNNEPKKKTTGRKQSHEFVRQYHIQNNMTRTCGERRGPTYPRPRKI